MIIDYIEIDKVALIVVTQNPFSHNWFHFSDINNVHILQPTFLKKGIFSLEHKGNKIEIKFNKKEADYYTNIYTELNNKMNTFSQKIITDVSNSSSYSDEDMEVVGTYYYDGYKIISGIVRDKGDIWNVGGYQTHRIELTLIPELENEYDANAIAVVSEHPTPPRARISRSGKIGHLPKNHGIKLNNPVKVKAKIKEGYGEFYVKISKKDISKLRELNLEK